MVTAVSRLSRSFRVGVIGVLAACCALTAACGGKEQAQPTAPSSATTTSSPPTTAATATRLPTFDEEKEAVLEQYKRMWEVHVQLANTPRQQWDALLDPVTVGEMKATLITAAEENVNKKQYLEGKFIPHVQNFSISGDEATFADCQDASGVVVRNNSTNKIVTMLKKLEPRNMVATRGVNGKWKISSLHSLKGVCDAKA